MSDLRKTMQHGRAGLPEDRFPTVGYSRKTPGRDGIPSSWAFDEERFRSKFRKGWAEGIAAAQRVAEKIGGEFPVKTRERVSAGQGISDEDAEKLAEDWAVVMAKLTYGQNPWPERWPVFQEGPFEDGPR